MISMPRGMNTLVVYILLVALGIVLGIFFMLDILPFFYPLMAGGDYWPLWLTAGLFGFLLESLMMYFVLKVMNYEYKQWRQASFLVAIFFTSGTSLAYVFDKILPFNFEPFRSLVFPAMIFTIVFVVIARFRYPQKDSAL
jgi:uncharacterized protein YacL